MKVVQNTCLTADSFEGTQGGLQLVGYSESNFQIGTTAVYDHTLLENTEYNTETKELYCSTLNKLKPFLPK